MRNLIDLVETSDPTTSAKFRQWFSGSVVVDGQGSPLLVYRGEHGDHVGDTFHTLSGSISFGSQETAELYAREPNDQSMAPVRPRVHACYLRMTNPVMNDPNDPYLDASRIEKAIGREKTRQIIVEQQELYEYTNNWEELCEDYDTPLAAFDDGKEVYAIAFRFFDNPKYVSWFVEAGFDGAIHAGYGQNHDEAEFKIFSAEQAWPIGSPQNLREFLTPRGDLTAFHEKKVGRTGYTFTVQGKEFVVMFQDEGEGEFYLSFTGADGRGKQVATLLGDNAPYKVFSGVLAAVLRFIESNEVDQISFKVDNAEEKRVRTYDSLLDTAERRRIFPQDFTWDRDGNNTYYIFRRGHR